MIKCKICLEIFTPRIASQRVCPECSRKHLESNVCMYCFKTTKNLGNICDDCAIRINKADLLNNIYYVNKAVEE